MALGFSLGFKGLGLGEPVKEPLSRFPALVTVEGSSQVLEDKINSTPYTSRFLSSPSIVMVPFFLLFGLNKGALN